MGRTIGLHEPVLVSSQGKVRWLTPIILDSFCKQFVRYFPFDDQYCPMKFYSWNYDNQKLHLKLIRTNMLSNYTGKFEKKTTMVCCLASVLSVLIDKEFSFVFFYIIF